MYLRTTEVKRASRNLRDWEFEEDTNEKTFCDSSSFILCLLSRLPEFSMYYFILHKSDGDVQLQSIVPSSQRGQLASPAHHLGLHEKMGDKSSADAFKMVAVMVLIVVAAGGGMLPTCLKDINSGIISALNTAAGGVFFASAMVSDATEYLYTISCQSENIAQEECYDGHVFPIVMYHS